MAKTREEKALTTIRIYKHRLPQLKWLSLSTGKSQTEIVDSFIKQLFETVEPHVAEALLKKKKVTFSVSISAGVMPDMIVRSRKIDMSKSNEQLDKEMIEDAEREFEKLEGKTNALGKYETNAYGMKCSKCKVDFKVKNGIVYSQDDKVICYACAKVGENEVLEGKTKEPILKVKASIRTKKGEVKKP